MDENAFSILRITEAIVPETEHAVLQDAALAIGTAYAQAKTTQPAFTHMPEYLRTLRQDVRRILTEHGIGETKAIRDAVEEFAIHAYGDGQ
jgi:type I restriction enzyme R subunit